jgi:UDP-3-O-[3-hydroxymyristoyl] glucosamine N-acyltransferase
VRHSATTQELADLVNGKLVGDPHIIISGIQSLQSATSSEISFLHNDRYQSLLSQTKAAAVLLGRETSFIGTQIICTDPSLAYAEVMRHFHRLSVPEAYISPKAHVSSSATIGDSVCIEAFAWIGAEAEIGDGTWIQSGVRVGAQTKIGRNCRLMANSVVQEGCQLGDSVWLNPGAVIGGEGFGFALSTDSVIKIPQIGTVVIEDDVEIGANAQLGERCMMVAYSAIAGSAQVGHRVMMAGRSSVLGHTRVEDGSRLAVLTVVNKDNGGALGGFPAVEHRKWLRMANSLKELPAMLSLLRRWKKES